MVMVSPWARRAKIEESPLPENGEVVRVTVAVTDWHQIRRTSGIGDSGMDIVEVEAISYR